MTMLGGVAICCDVDRRIIDRRMEVGYADVVAGSLDEAIALAQGAASRGEPLGITLEGNAVDVFEECLRREFRPDIVTEMTPAHDPLAYIPTGLTAEQAELARSEDRDGYFERSRDSMVRQLDGHERLLRPWRRRVRVRQPDPPAVRGARDGRRDEDPRVRGRLPATAVPRRSRPVSLDVHERRGVRPRPPRRPGDGALPRRRHPDSRGSHWPASTCRSRACRLACATSGSVSASASASRSTS